MAEDEKELLIGIEKVAEFSSQLSKVLLSLGQGFKTLQSSCNKTEESVIDIKESLKKTRSKMEVIALQAKSGSGIGGGTHRRESLIPPNELPTSNVEGEGSANATPIGSPAPSSSSKGMQIQRITAPQQQDWLTHCGNVLSQIKSSQNDFTGEILDVMEGMHEVNESLGLIDGESDLMAKMNVEEKLDALERRLMVQNKMNEVFANFMQSDTVSMTFHTFGTKMQELEGQISTRSTEHENLKNEVALMKDKMEKNHEYTKSLERTIMKILTGKAGDEEEELYDKKHEATVGTTPLAKRDHGGGLLGRIKNVEEYVDNELFPTIEGFKEFDERTKNNLDTLRYEMDETTEILDHEFSEENKAKLAEAISNSGGGGHELQKNIKDIKLLWEGFYNDITHGLHDLFQRLTKEMTHLLKKPKKLKSAGGESEEALRKEDAPTEPHRDEEHAEEEETEIDYENIFFSEEFQEQFNEKDYQLAVMLVKLRDYLSDVVGTLEPRETDSETLEAIHPQLVKLHTQVSYLLEHDHETKGPTSPNLCLDDIICEDRKHDLRDRLVRAIDSCDYTLSRGVSSYKMLLRVDNLDKHEEVKEVKGKVDTMEKEINEILESKADKKETASSLGKKTDKGEMLQLKEVLYSRMDDLQATANASGSSNGNPNAMLAYSSGGNVDSSEIVAMNERFDLLYRQFQDLSLGSQLLVSRNEVEEAMKGVLLEIKRVRSTALDKKAVDKLIERKTDQKEFEKMINALAGSLEGLREYVDAMNGNSQKLPSALKHKCLVCDKLTDPVSALAELEQTARQLTASKSKREKHGGILTQAGYPQRPNTTQGGYHKVEDPTTRSPPATPNIDISNVHSMEDLSTMNHNPMAAYDASVSIYQQTDNSLKRNVVDLRPISSPISSARNITKENSSSMAAVQFVEVAPGKPGSSSSNNNNNNSQMSKSMPEFNLQRRIKSSAGGGVGNIGKNADNRR